MSSQVSTNRPVTVDLSDEINHDRLRELEHFAGIGRLSASLLHEISNPLTAALLWLEQYDNQQSIHIRHVRRSIRLLQRYVEAARQQVRRESHYRKFCVRPELEQVRHILEPLARRQNVRLRFAPVGSYKLYGDPVKFQQIIANLVNNAIDSYRSVSCAAGDRMVHLKISTGGGCIVVKVSDKGCGITGEQLGQLFQPFYSTKSSAGLGLGIGLFAVKQYIETDFKGSVTVKSSVRHGTQFTVRLRMLA